MKRSLAEIAQNAGCSIATVSRILSGNASRNRISADTVAKVLEVARQMNYTPKKVAHSLRKEKSFTIGLILPSISNPFFAEMASVIISEAHTKGYTTFILDAMEEPAVFEDGVKRMVNKNVDGIIAVPCSNNSILLENVDYSGTPVILADRFIKGANLSYVTTNNYEGSYAATKELIRHGHRSIVCIQGEKQSTPNLERVKGYREAMSDEGLSENIVVTGNDFSIQNGYLETKMLLDSTPQARPTAIFALGNTIALGVLKAIQENHLSVPDDISLITFDNYHYMDFMSPAITRVSQPVADMSKLCAKMLFDRIDRLDTGGTLEGLPTAKIRLSPELITRDSVAFVRDI